jgi:hypothetical protein
MLSAMQRAWLGGVFAAATACGPVVSTETMGTGEDESTGSSSSDSDDTGSDPVTTMLPGSSSTTVPMPMLDIGGDVAIDGTYLLAVATIVDPGHPLQYFVRAQVVNGVMHVVMQPLSLDIGSTTAPRMAYGDPLVYGGIPVEAGCFTIDMGEVFAAGATNPITGSDLTATIVLNGCFEGTSWCGNVEGQVSMPLQLDLTGSTFAATEAGFSMLPVDFPIGC